MARATKAKAKAEAEQQELDDALSLEGENGLYLVRVGMPATYNQGRRTLQPGEEFFTEPENAIEWHEMQLVTMVDPTYEEATAEAEE